MEATVEMIVSGCRAHCCFLIISTLFSWYLAFRRGLSRPDASFASDTRYKGGLAPRPSDEEYMLFYPRTGNRKLEAL